MHYYNFRVNVLDFLIDPKKDYIGDIKGAFNYFTGQQCEEINIDDIDELNEGVIWFNMNTNKKYGAICEETGIVKFNDIDFEEFINKFKELLIKDNIALSIIEDCQKHSQNIVDKLKELRKLEG